MTQHDDGLRLRHMLDHSVEAIEMIRGRVRGDLETDRMLELALVRLVEIVGEAAARVNEDTRNLNQRIPWLAVVGMRNRLIHGYDAVDLDVLWATIEDDLPALVLELRGVLDSSQSDLDTP